MRGILSTVLLCAISCCVPSDADAQLQQGTIQGTIVGPDGSPVDGALVTLLDPLGHALTTVMSRNGRFQVTNVAPGSYSLRADAPPLRASVPTVTVGSALTITVDLRLSAVLSEQIVVQADQPGADSTATRITLSGEAVRNAPARVRIRGLQDAVATAPGWSTEDNGLLHVRGVDDGFLYVIDGVPVYERLDGLFGTAPDPTMIDSATVVTGYVPPEFGFKAGGVIEVRSATRTADTWISNVDLGGATDDGRDFSTVAGGPIGGTTALTVGMAGQRSSRFLDPVHPDNFHNEGGALGGGLQFGWTSSPGSLVGVVAGFGGSNFDVPNGEDQERAGQDQQQHLRNAWQTLSWQRSWSSNTVSQLSGYQRLGSSRLIGSPHDTPLSTDADRRLRRVGVLASVTHRRGSHLLKSGTEVSRLSLDEHFAFAVTEAEAAHQASFSDEVLEHTRARPFEFDDSATPRWFSFYVQDSIRATNRLTLDLGVRADWSRMLIAASQASPRIGVSYRWSSTQTTLRGSFGRFFQPPQSENLLLASSEQARELSPFVQETGGGGRDLLPERQTAIEVALNQPLTRTMHLDVSYWRRRAHNAADPNVFLGTTVIFPNSVARGRASGVDVRVEFPRRAGWSGYLSYTNSLVTQFGPITGGLFLEDDVIDIGPGTEFTPDHDQRNVAAFSLAYDQERLGSSLSFAGRYESGTPLEIGEDQIDELAQRPGSELVDFDRGRVKPRLVFDVTGSQRLLRERRVDVNVRFALLNVTGQRWAYNFGNPFSGTHFGPGRTLQVGFRFEFR